MIHITIYFITFLISLLGFKYTNYLYIKSEKNYFVFGLLFGVIPLCLLAAFRGDSVGTDVLVYGKSTFYLAQNTASLKDLLLIHNQDFLFGFLAYIISRLGGTVQYFWFFIELLCIMPVYIIAVKKRKQAPIEITMLIYMFIYYPMNFNIMRQGIATSFFLLAFFYLFEGKNKYFLILTIVGLLFHLTSVLGVLLCFAAYLIVKIKNKRERWGFIIIFILVFSILFLNWNIILDWAINTVHILPSKLSGYLKIFSNDSYYSQSYYFQIGTYGIVEFILRVIILILPLFISFVNGEYNDSQIRMYRYVSLISIYVYGMCMMILGTTYGYRVTMLLDLFNVFYLSAMYKKTAQKNKINVVVPILVLLSVGYFVVIYYYFGAHGVVPYVLAQG